MLLKYLINMEVYMTNQQLNNEQIKELSLQDNNLGHHMKNVLRCIENGEKTIVFRKETATAITYNIYCYNPNLYRYSITNSIKV